MERDLEGNPDASNMSASLRRIAKCPCNPPPRADGTERALVNNWRCNSCRVVLVGLPTNKDRR